MTQEEKNLILKDLCSRLPYGVKVRYATTTVDGIEVVNVATLNMVSTYFGEIIMSCHEGHEVRDIKMDGNVFKNIMPLLRPMSSMTEEEILHIQTLVQNKNHELYNRIEECGATGTPDWKLYEISYIRTDEEIDYLNSRHLDWRGLIKKGLALKAPEGMYNI